MRTWQKWVGIMLVVAALLFASAGLGEARRGGHGFRGHRHHHHSFHHGHKHGHRSARVGIGIGIGLGPFWGPYWPRYAYPPVVVSPPPVVIQAPPPQPYWYYCEAFQAYYPYVQQCPGGWRQVVPTPP